MSYEIDWSAEAGSLRITGRCWANSIADILEQVARATERWELIPPPAGPPVRIEMRVQS